MGEPVTHPALELENVGRSWTPGKSVFKELNLKVPDEGITVLLGPSGCGKSTLLRCAASLDPPDRGRILVKGRLVENPSPDRQMVLQSDNQLLPWLTVRENILFPLRNARPKMNKPEDSEKTVARILEDVGLPGSSDAYPAQLSGGMKQRAVLARALVVKPAILLLDEPFASLDTVIRSRLQLLLGSLKEKRPVAMLLVTHDVSEALILADRLVFMSASGILSPPEENPLGEIRDPESQEFFEASTRMKRRYRTLLNPVDSQTPVLEI